MFVAIQPCQIGPPFFPIASPEFQVPVACPLLPYLERLKGEEVGLQGLLCAGSSLAPLHVPVLVLLAFAQRVIFLPGTEKWCR